ncbi:MAG: hypothetical protein P1P88_07125 [Bacteroidales bacterium]|nr:hypothetical protein [Bacteroidales bacterium]
MKYLLLIFLFPYFSCITNQHDDIVDNREENVLKDTILPENSSEDIIIPEYESDFPLEDESRFINADYYSINIPSEGNYKNLKTKILEKRENYRQKYVAATNEAEKNKIIKLSGEYVTETIVNHIIPFWYGMPWSLSGYSDIPNVGEVGCSYFVSNTLKHCGFKVNRYRLAQQNTKNIAFSIQLNDSILIIKGNGDISSVKNYFLENKKDGLYYVGLDSHVGYLLFKKGELFFIQSNYAYPQVVLTEFAEKSDVFYSNFYYIADITWNDALIKNWIMSTEIQVVKK